MFSPTEINLIVNSGTGNNISADGSSFEVQLEEPINIPAQAINVTVACEESTVWWTIPNIIADVNDKWYMSFDDGVNPVLNLDITIPQGLYDLSGLNQAILREVTNLGAPSDPPLIQLSADEATQKVELQINYTGVTIDFTPTDTSRGLLGFNAQVIGPTAVTPTTILAPETAAFNQVNYFLVHSDLVSKGIRFNNSYSQTVAQVLIDVPPGSQIVSRPFNPARSSADELSGSSRTNIRFSLTDDLNRPVNTNGESWTTRLVIRYLMPHIIK